MVKKDDTEEIVLSRWGRLKQWFEICMATKKFAMFLWALIFGITVPMAVGEITKTNPLRDAAIEVGLVEPQVIDFIKSPVDDQPDIVVSVIPKHTHQHEHEVIDHTHDTPMHTHADKPHKHTDHIHASHTYMDLAKELEKLLPKNHKGLH